MQRVEVLCLAVLIGALGACASGGTKAPKPQKAASAASAIERAKSAVPLSVDSEAPDPGALGGFSIPPGKCGMVLWARAGTATVPVFQALEDGQGLMEIDGRITGLSRYQVAGETRAAMPQIQRFKASTAGGGAVTIDAETEWGKNFPGGSYVKGGTLTLTGADGWTRVLPVAGIAGCKA